MNNLLINKYKPKFIENVKNLDKNYIDLINILIKNSNINILITGKIGTGKSNVINIIVNKYYDTHIDINNNENILCINSLKEQGISYYRTELKTFCQTKSSLNNKKKCVILDDFHLLNEQGQQIFRNYIDKYNKNVNFIATTSNIQNIINNIQSRLYIIELKKISKSDIYELSNKIIKNENININDTTLEKLICLSNLSPIKIINFFQKIILINQEINEKNIYLICSNISEEQLISYTKLCKDGNFDKAICILNDMFDNGYSVIDILDGYYKFLNTTNIISDDNKYKIIKIICKYIIKFNYLHENIVELSFLTNNIISIFN
jgi:replication factor C subunit 2/4